MKRFLYLFGLFSLCLVLFACSQGPDKATLTSQVQQKLDNQFKSGLFKIVSLKRQGIAPAKDKASGESRLIVYFNTELEFLQDYSLTAWDNLNLATLANLLGATEKGIIGFKPKGNQKGDVLEVYGTSPYVLKGDQWQPVAYLAGAPVTGPEVEVDNMGPKNTTAPSDAVTVLQQLDAIVKTDTTGPKATIVENELNSALRGINLRIDRLENILPLASGEPGGEYYQVGEAMQSYVSGKALQIKNYASAGSVENCGLVETGSVDLAFAQNDILAMAYGGTGIFDSRSPMTNLRALGSLFPEPIQIVVLASSDIHTVADLKGKKVDIGLPRSGSRVNALEILEAHGIDSSDLAEAQEKGFVESAKNLQSGAIDAFFVTLAAPARVLQDLAATQPIRILSLAPEALGALRQRYAYLVPLTLPAHTYPGQDEDVQTLSVMATLLARADMPDDRVRGLLDSLFQNIDAAAQESFQASTISRSNAESGLSIPLHPAAEKYYSRSSS